MLGDSIGGARAQTFLFPTVGAKCRRTTLMEIRVMAMASVVVAANGLLSDMTMRFPTPWELRLLSQRHKRAR